MPSSVLLGLGLTGVALYLVVPSPVFRDVVYSAFGIGAAVAVVIGIVRYRPDRRAAWLLLAAGLALEAAGDLAWDAIDASGSTVPLPSIADVFYLSGYALIAVAVLRLLPRRRGGLDWLAVIDATILTCGAAMLSWEFLMRPYVDDASQPLPSVIVAAAYPLADLLLLGATLRLLLAAGNRQPALRILVVGLGTFLVADTLYAGLSLAGAYEPGAIDTLWLIAYLAIAAVGIHPSMVELGRPVDAAPVPLRISRLVLLATASLMAPLVLLLEAARGEKIDAPVIAAGSALLFLLVLGRLLIVIDDERRTKAELASSEERLRASQARYRMLGEQASDGILVIEPDGRFGDANPAACAMLGFDRTELIGLRVEDVVLSDPAQGLGPKLEILESGGTVLAERPLRHSSGSTVPTEINVRLLPTGQFHAIVRDITERKAAEAERERLADAVNRAAREAAEAYRSVFDDNPAPMWVYDAATLRFLSVNDAAVRLYGYSRDEFREMTLADIRPPEDVPALLASARPGGPEHEISGPWRHRHRDGTVVEVEIASHEIVFDGHPARLVLTTDVTRRRALETQLRQAQKMEAVGRLAGGVAHDFNNLLSAIRGYAELSLMSTDRDSEVHAFLAEVVRASDRAKALTQRLLTFARQQPTASVTVDLGDVLKGIEPMLHQVVDESVRLTLDLPPAPVPACVDPNLVEQALLNLVINARDAMPTGGAIRVGLRSQLVEAGDSAGAVGLAPGTYAALSVEDTGHGIAPEHLPLLFEPFFTTKPANQGTGLGLSIVYSVATGAGGTVRVDSAVGRGTRIELLIPLAEAAVTALPAEVGATARPNGGNEQVLLVEDEPAIRSFVARVLSGSGYAVRSAGSAEEALPIAAAIPPPSLLITDVLLPGMSGPELVDVLRPRMPGLGVLFISGYDGNRLATAGVLGPRTGFLAKPFSTDDLFVALRAVSTAAAVAGIEDDEAAAEDLAAS